MADSAQLDQLNAREAARLVVERERRLRPLPLDWRPDRLPGGDCTYEVKWGGFRVIASTEGGLEVRSRRGWEMSERLPELAALADGLVLDGELVAFGADGRPSFPLLSLRVLHGRALISVVLMVFDVLRVEGADAMCLPYAERRALLEALELEGPSWRTGDVRRRRGASRGDALHGLEGVVARKRTEPYTPAERAWVKVEHRDYWRFGQGLESPGGAVLD